MSECVVRMEIPHVCITENGFYGYCPMDRVLCAERNSPPDMTIREAYEAMTDKIPSWCPIICSLPKGHGRLVDKDEMLKKIENYHRYMTVGRESDPRCIIEDSPTIVPAEAERSET